MPNELCFIFVGERPSPRAIKLGITWQSAGLSGRTLFEALLAAGIVPQEQYYLNLYQSPFKDIKLDLLDEQLCITRIRQLTQQKGLVVIGMGRIVQVRLEKYNIVHHKLIHPAARGAIRRKECYQAHVKENLEAIRHYHSLHALPLCRHNCSK